MTLVILESCFASSPRTLTCAAVVTAEPQCTDTPRDAHLFPGHSDFGHRPSRSLRAEAPPRRQGALQHRRAAGAWLAAAPGAAGPCRGGGGGGGSAARGPARLARPPAPAGEWGRAGPLRRSLAVGGRAGVLRQTGGERRGLRLLFPYLLRLWGRCPGRAGAVVGGEGPAGPGRASSFGLCSASALRLKGPQRCAVTVLVALQEACAARELWLSGRNVICVLEKLFVVSACKNCAGVPLNLLQVKAKLQVQ